MQSSHTLTRWCGVLLLSALFTFGCERKPEDLEQWRNAEGGYERLQEWAASKEESPAVRARAVQMLIEEDLQGELPAILEKVKDPVAKKAMVDAAVDTTEKLWAKQDYPTLTDEMKEEGVNMKVGASEAVRGVEAAYYIYPFTEGEDQEKLQEIFGEWLSEDHDLRSQLSQRITLEQLLPLSGQKGFEGMMAWFKESKSPANIAAAIRQHGDEEAKKKFATVILERAMKDHPNIDAVLAGIIRQTEDPVIVPYLERAMDDPKTPGPLADVMMDSYIKIKGPAATTKLNELVAKRQDIMRSVAFTRLIEVRGEAGVTQAATALPLEVEAYPTSGENTLDKDADYLCNIIKTELATTHEVKDPKPVIKKMLTSSRWPAQAIAIRCAEREKWSDWKPAIDELATSAQVVPGWGGAEGTTLGQIAQDASAKL